MIQNPVFIVGTERSGSNLLRLILNELDEIAIPHPPHLMRDLSKVIGRYGDLSQDANFERLIADAVRLVELHFAPWPFRLDQQLILRQALKRDLYPVYAAIYEQYRTHTGKPRWGCKSTFMVHHVQEILQHHKSPQFIHLVRDPRDVAVSARRSVFCHYHPFFVAKLWAHEQAKAVEWRDKLSGGTWYTLRYEDLIQSPEDALQNLCKFLGADYSEKLLKFSEKPAAQELSGLSRSWENVGRPVLKNNSAKYRRNLSAEDIRIIESVAIAEMQAYGYQPDTELKELAWEPNLMQRARYRIEEEFLMWKEESKALLKDRNAKFRLMKKSYLMKLRFR